MKTSQVGICIVKLKSTQNSQKDSSQHAMMSFSFTFVSFIETLETSPLIPYKLMEWMVNQCCANLWDLCTQPSACVSVILLYDDWWGPLAASRESDY